MAKSKISAEHYDEEIAKLSEELSTVQHELSDTLTLNDEFIRKIEVKDREIVVKDARLKAAVEKNAAEQEQLYLESSSLLEALQHEVNFHQTEVQGLRMSRQRYLDVARDNERLKSSIQELEGLLSRENFNHGQELHNINKERNAMRIAMEEKLKKELAGLEISFQQQAFDALHDRQKQAMFENAKLKDEVAMQGVGITNLSGRLYKQRKASEKCRAYLRKYRQKADRLREQLTIITGRKNEIARRKKDLQDEEAMLSEQSQSILAKYRVSSSEEQVAKAEELVAQYIDALREVRMSEATLASWRERYEQLTNLHLELKPTTDDERCGLYSEALFAIYPMMRAFQLATAHTQPAEGHDQRSRRSSTIDTARTDGSRSVFTDISEETAQSHPQEERPLQQQIDDPFNLASLTASSSPAGQRRRMSQLKQGSENILTVMQHEDGLPEALKALEGKESRIVTFIQLACEKEKGRMRKQRKTERALQTQKNSQESTPHPQSQSRGRSAESGVASDDEEDRGQNMLAWAVMKMVNLWVQTRPRRIIDSDLMSVTAESLNLVQPSKQNLSTADSSVLGPHGSQSTSSFSSQGLRSSPHDRRIALISQASVPAGESALLTAQQVQDHHLHQEILRQLAKEKKHGLLGDSHHRRGDEDEDEMSQRSSSSSLSHILEEGEEEDEEEIDVHDEFSKLASDGVHADAAILPSAMVASAENSVELLPSQQVARSHRHHHHQPQSDHRTGVAQQHSPTTSSSVQEGVQGLNSVQTEAEKQQLQCDGVLLSLEMSPEALALEMAQEDEWDAAMASPRLSTADPSVQSAQEIEEEQHRRRWLSRKPSFIPNIFAAEKQADMMNARLRLHQSFGTTDHGNASKQSPLDLDMMPVLVQSKESFEIGPPLHLRSSSAKTSSVTTDHQELGRQRGRASERARRVLTEALQAAQIMQQSSSHPQLDGISVGIAHRGESALDNSQYQEASAVEEEKVMTNSELRHMDPFLQKKKIKSNVAVSQKVLKSMPKSLSSPLLVTMQHQPQHSMQLPSPLVGSTGHRSSGANSGRNSPMLLTPLANTGNLIGKHSQQQQRLPPRQVLPQQAPMGATVGIGAEGFSAALPLPMKKVNQLASSTGALPKYQLR